MSLSLQSKLKKLKKSLDLRNPYHPRYCKPPKLTLATLDGDDVMDQILEIYGENRGWCCRFWRAKDVFEEFEGEMSLYMEWENETPDKGKHTSRASVKKNTVINQFNIPFGTYWGSETGI